MRGCGCALQAAIATLGASGKVADMDLDEVETTEKKTKKKDKKKRTAAEVEADIGNNCAVPIYSSSTCMISAKHGGLLACASGYTSHSDFMLEASLLAAYSPMQTPAIT